MDMSSRKVREKKYPYAKIKFTYEDFQVVYFILWFVRTCVCIHA